MVLELVRLFSCETKMGFVRTLRLLSSVAYVSGILKFLDDYCYRLVLGLPCSVFLFLFNLLIGVFVICKWEKLKAQSTRILICNYS